VTKDVFMLDSADLPNELPAFERWYLRYHAPEVLSRRGPLLPRMLAYTPLPIIPEAEAYGHYNLRVTEAWRYENEPPAASPPPISFRWVAPWQKGDAIPGRSRKPPVEFSVPTEPTEVFLGDKFHADEKTILRWFTVTKYPDGVPIEQGEDWFLNVHSKEVLQQPGLIAYFSFRTLVRKWPPYKWHRLTELWYEDFHGWKKSVIEAPPKYTPPKWANYGKYPFLEPNVDFVSTFLMEHPNHEYVKEVVAYP
jgi:hypothetical protein